MNKPFWVVVGLIGIKSRKSAVNWLNASIFGVALLVLGTIIALTKILETSLMTGMIYGIFYGAIFSSASFWYWSCIKWMDANNGWTE